MCATPSCSLYCYGSHKTIFPALCCRVVLSQLSGSGRGDIGSYNTEQYAALKTLLEEKHMRDGDEWLSVMMRRNKMLGKLTAVVTACQCHYRTLSFTIAADFHNTVQLAAS